MSERITVNAVEALEIDEYRRGMIFEIIQEALALQQRILDKKVLDELNGIIIQAHGIKDRTRYFVDVTDEESDLMTQWIRRLAFFEVVYSFTK